MQINCFQKPKNIVITEVLEIQLRKKSAIKKSNDVSMTPCHHFQIHEVLKFGKFIIYIKC